MQYKDVAARRTLDALAKEQLMLLREVPVAGCESDTRGAVLPRLAQGVAVRGRRWDTCKQTRRRGVRVGDPCGRMALRHHLSEAPDSPAYAFTAVPRFVAPPTSPSKWAERERGSTGSPASHACEGL